MIERLRNGPWWVLAVVGGAVFFVPQFALVLLDATSWRGRLVGGAFALVCSACLGIVMGRYSVRMRSRVEPFLRGADGTPLTPAERKALGRATWRGPLPTDPHERHAVEGLARTGYAGLRRQRWWAVPMYLLVAANSVYLAVAVSAWWALTTPLFVGLAAYWLWAYRRARRRLALLGTPPD